MFPRNRMRVNLTLTENGVKKFKNTPTFANLLHPSQSNHLKVGTNELTVNMTVWGSLQRVCGYDPNNMTVNKI